MSAGDASFVGLQGVFGGTFNPVHFGHLRSALELVESLQMEHLRLMPSARPPHREAPDCSAEHRAACGRHFAADAKALAAQVPRI